MPVMRLTREISTKGALWKPLVEKQVDDRGVGMIGSVDRLFSILNERPHVTLIWEINGVCKKCNQEHLQQQTHNCLVSIKDLVLNDFQMSCDNLFEPEKIACPFYPMENNDGKSMHIAIKRSFSLNLYASYLMSWKILWHQVSRKYNGILSFSSSQQLERHMNSYEQQICLYQSFYLCHHKTLY